VARETDNALNIDTLSHNSRCIWDREKKNRPGIER